MFNIHFTNPNYIATYAHIGPWVKSSIDVFSSVFSSKQVGKSSWQPVNFPVAWLIMKLWLWPGQQLPVCNVQFFSSGQSFLKVNKITHQEKVLRQEVRHPVALHKDEAVQTVHKVWRMREFPANKGRKWELKSAYEYPPALSLPVYIYSPEWREVLWE